MLDFNLRRIKMSVKDNVIRLWKEQRPDIKSVAELERKLNLSNGIISQWDKSRPSTKSAQKVADFFSVPLSSIYDDVTDKSIRLDKPEQELVTMFRKTTDGMSDEDKEKFTESFNDLMNAAKNLLK